MMATRMFPTLAERRSGKTLMTQTRTKVCCPVCGELEREKYKTLGSRYGFAKSVNSSGFFRSRDVIEGTQIEAEEHCFACNLYCSEYGYGSLNERIGYAVIGYGWEDFTPRSDDDPITRLRKNTNCHNYRCHRSELLEEAKRLWNDPAARVWIGQAKGWEVSYHPTDWLVYADWLGEHGYPLNEAAVRTSVKEFREIQADASKGI
jgi:hypothetical protein